MIPTFAYIAKEKKYEVGIKTQFMKRDTKNRK